MGVIVSQHSFISANFIYRNAKWLLPLVFMAVLTPFTPYLDRVLESYFYFKEPPHFRTNAFSDFMFNYAVFPAQIVAVGALIVFILSFFLSRLRKWQNSALALVLTMALGAGFIVHTVFKDHWGRPRPRQTVEFGGKQAFRPYWQPNLFEQPEPSKSFPCGHCTMGFYFFSVALLCKRLGHKGYYWFLFAIAIALGTALGLARMMMGGHFFSDVFMSGVIMWYTACLFDYLLCSHLSNPGIKQ